MSNDASVRRRLVAGLACAVLLAGVRLGTAGPAPDEPLLGRSLLVRHAKVVKLSCRPPAGAVGLPGASADPTVVGAMLEIEDTDGVEAQTFALDAAGWRGLGNPAGSRGYVYRGSSAPGDCRQVVIKANAVKATCKGTGIALMPPFVGDARAVLTLGADAKRYCAVFGGIVVRNEPGFLKRTRAEAPAECAVTTTTTTTSTSTSSTVATTSTTVTPTTTITTTCTTPGYCGDGHCGGIVPEFCQFCPSDCGVCGTCDNDDVCERDAGEHCFSCPGDCGFCTCDGNEDTVCEPLAGEHCSTCGDCKPCGTCGDGGCAGGETPATCPADCAP